MNKESCNLIGWEHFRAQLENKIYRDWRRNKSKKLCKQRFIYEKISVIIVRFSEKLRQVTGPLFWCYIGLRPDFDKTQQNWSEEKTNKHQETPDIDYFLLITNIVFVLL